MTSPSSRPSRMRHARSPRRPAEAGRAGRPLTSASLNARIMQVYEATKTIATAEGSEKDAVVGRYLAEQGYRVVRVGPPGGPSIAGLAESLSDVELRVDLVVAFERPEIHEIVRETMLIGARALWFQPDAATSDAVGLARAAGLTVVVNRCIAHTHRELGLGPIFPAR